MIERLEIIKKHYDELNAELLKPEILSDVQKTKELSKQISDYKEIVEYREKYIRILEDLEAAKIGRASCRERV